MKVTDGASGGSDAGTATSATLFSAFLRIGLLSFGGPAAQIALMHRVLVVEKRWLDERGFLNALNFCMLLPGPEAMQLATYAGWRLRGVRGGLIAGMLFVLPGAIVVLALSALYAALGTLPTIAALFMGVKAAVLVIVIEALVRVGRRALRDRSAHVIAGLAFVGLFVLALPYPLIVLGAAAWGYATARTTSGPDMTPPVPVPIGGTLVTVVTWTAIWAAPLVLAAVAGGGLLLDVGLFFSKLAVVTFGGAYAVLAYMAQEAVQGYGWLTAGQMLDGLGLAETTPGPLILVTEFVAYMSGHGAGGIELGLAAAAMALWVTFVPCFLWIFAGAPYLGWISAQPRLSGALSSITAAVVGVILNLAVWFALHVLFGVVTRTQLGPTTLWLPEPASFEPRAAAISVAAGVALFGLRWSLARVLALSAALGWALTALPSGP